MTRECSKREVGEARKGCGGERSQGMMQRSGREQAIVDNSARRGERVVLSAMPALAARQQIIPGQRRVISALGNRASCGTMRSCADNGAAPADNAAPCVAIKERCVKVWQQVAGGEAG